MSSVQQEEGAISREAKNSIGRRVKYADLQDNLDITRITATTTTDMARAAKYQRAIAQLNSTLSQNSI